jgi:hypothetical protein
MITSWITVRPGAIVKLRDGYAWTVEGVAPAAGTGDLTVTVSRAGPGPQTVTVPRGREVELLSQPAPHPPTPEEERALALLRDALGAEVIRCVDSGWCAGVASEPCTCTVNCGTPHCVNF